MGTLSLEDFLKKTSGRSFSQWKDDKKIIFFIHPKAEIHSRITHRMPTVKVGDDQSPTLFSKNIICQNYDCPMDMLLDLCKQLPAEEPVLQFKYGNKKEIYTASDITGADGNENWKRRLFGRQGWLFPIVRIPTKIGSEEPRQEILELTKDVGNKIQKLIKQEMDDAAEEGDANQGNPKVNPYAIRIVFDDNATSPGNFYTVSKADKKKVTPEIKKLFKESPIDPTEWTKATEEKEVLKLIKDACINQFVITEMGLGSSIEKTKPKKNKVTGTKKLKFKSKHASNNDDDDSTPF